MPYSSGTFSLFTPGNPVVTGTTISSTWGNNTLSDIATGLSTCMLKNGTQTMTANLPMAGFKVTGLGAATTAGDALRYEQLINVYLPLAGGTLVGDLLFTDNLYDIGKSAATRPRDGFFSRNFVIGGTLNVTGHVTLEGITSTGATGSGLLVFGTSPTLTTAILGSSTATTQTAGDNSTKVATTAYVDSRPVEGTPTATTSGTTKDFTVPTTVKRITIMFKAVSTNGTSNYLIQIGPSGTPETTTYISAVQGTTTSSAGFLLTGASVAAADLASGMVILCRENSSTNSWAYLSHIYLVTSNVVNTGAGYKSCAGAINTVRVTTVSGDTFDAGEVNITYD